MGETETSSGRNGTQQPAVLKHLLKKEDTKKYLHKNVQKQKPGSGSFRPFRGATTHVKEPKEDLKSFNVLTHRILAKA